MIRCYSNVLYCWKMFNLRAELLSFDVTNDEEQQLKIGKALYVIIMSVG